MNNKNRNNYSLPQMDLFLLKFPILENVIITTQLMSQARNVGITFKDVYQGDSGVLAIFRFLSDGFIGVVTSIIHRVVH